MGCRPPWLLCNRGCCHHCGCCCGGGDRGARGRYHCGHGHLLPQLLSYVRLSVRCSRLLYASGSGSPQQFIVAVFQ